MQTSPGSRGPCNADTITTGAREPEENVHTGAPSRRFEPPRLMADVRVWAPTARSVILVTDSPDDPDTEHSEATEKTETTDTTETTGGIPMIRVNDAPGWWMVDATTIEEAPETTGLGGASAATRRYGFRILADDAGTQTQSGALSDTADAPVRPDPRSVRQPDGVHGLSALHTVDGSVWTDDEWQGRSVSGAVIYELHIGTFTPEGTLDTAITRLDHLVELGVDFVELMPVNAFNGDVGWGYDGVDWYAVQESYGGPDALARFVDACHSRGLGVVLDVVYNHLGPSGNYLPDFGPYLSDGATSWGAGLNLAGPDSDTVRDYIVENALRWFRDFHVDALRLDAVHALNDHRAVHILEELATETDALAAELGRPLSLIAESDLNDPRLITSRDRGGYGLTAQWDDDIHHAIHTLVSGERQGYYADFGSYAALAKVLRGGFFHDGTYSSFRRRHHGRPIPTDEIPASALLAYTCNHDQIGNRAIGDRPSAYLDPGQLAIKAALVLLSPFTPMLFMGEEWAASTPFQFFTSHPEPELGRATAEGRKAEFAEHGWDSAEIPDPQSPQTFADSKLDWSEPASGTHARVLEFYRALVALRKSVDDFADPSFDSVDVTYDEEAGWFAMHRGDHTVLVIIGADAVDVPIRIDPALSWTDVAVTESGVRSPGHNVVIGRRLPGPE